MTQSQPEHPWTSHADLTAVRCRLRPGQSKVCFAISNSDLQCQGVAVCSSLLACATLYTMLLHSADDPQLHEAAPAVSPSAVVRAQGIGKPCANKPRPVRITLALPSAKHAAFKAKKSLGQQHFRLADDLTKAQHRTRAQIRHVAAAVRERQLKSNPHFMGVSCMSGRGVADCCSLQA